MRLLEDIRIERMLTLALFGVALAVRLALFATEMGDQRHGSAEIYGSTALGFYNDGELTFREDEILHIREVPDNRSGDYRKFFVAGDRTIFTEFLPGPAVVLGILWKIVPWYTFAPYLILQIVLEAALIAWFYWVVSRYQRLLALLTALVMVVNIATIKRTLMMGYDFWPQFSVLVIFLGSLQLLREGRGAGRHVVLGVIIGLTFWFRNITTLLPFFLCGVVILTLKLRRYHRQRYALMRAAALMVPIALSLVLVSVYRHEVTGSYRPTRSTFWHTFFAGVGQFSNPYGVENRDASVWELGKRLNPGLAQYELGQMYRMPDSPYEQTLAQEARNFIREQPGLFLRNTIYRVGIMISPLLYQSGDLVPARLAGMLVPLGYLMVPLWLLGMFALYKEQKLIFLVAATIYGYFFLTFGWFYVVGRVILPFLFISVLVYLNGVAWIWHRIAGAEVDDRS